MTKKELLVIHEHVLNAITKVYNDNLPMIRFETYATNIIEDIEGAIKQLFEELAKELPETVSDIAKRAKEKMVKEYLDRIQKEHYETVNDKKKALEYVKP